MLLTSKSVLFCHSHKTSSLQVFLYKSLCRFDNQRSNAPGRSSEAPPLSPPSHSLSVQSSHGNSRQDTWSEITVSTRFKYHLVSQNTLHLVLHSYNVHSPNTREHPWQQRFHRSVCGSSAQQVVSEKSPDFISVSNKQSFNLSLKCPKKCMKLSLFTSVCIRNSSENTSFKAASQGDITTDQQD